MFRYFWIPHSFRLHLPARDVYLEANEDILIRIQVYHPHSTSSYLSYCSVHAAMPCSLSSQGLSGNRAAETFLTALFSALLCSNTSHYSAALTLCSQSTRCRTEVWDKERLKLQVRKRNKNEFSQNKQEALSGRSQWRLERGSKVFSWRPVSFLLSLQMPLYYEEALRS